MNITFDEVQELINKKQKYCSHCGAEVIRSLYIEKSYPWNRFDPITGQKSKPNYNIYSQCRKIRFIPSGLKIFINNHTAHKNFNWGISLYEISKSIV